MIVGQAVHVFVDICTMHQPMVLGSPFAEFDAFDCLLPIDDLVIASCLLMPYCSPRLELSPTACFSFVQFWLTQLQAGDITSATGPGSHPARGPPGAHYLRHDIK